MFQIDQLPGRTALIEGREWLYFSGTAYLGMVQNKQFHEFIIEGLQRYGAHYGGSRLAAVQLPAFEEAEAVLAELTGAPAALVVSSGTVAGQLAVGHLMRSNTRPFFAPRLHPALWPQNYLPTSCTFEAWSQRILRILRRWTAEKAALPVPLLLSDALDSLYARAYDFSWLSELPRDFPIRIIIDDSHGLGVTGPDGGGIFSQINAPDNVELLVVSSLGKAFGVPGGVILGEKERLEEIRQNPHFGGASPVPPAFLHAFIRAQELYRENRQRLRHHVRLFKEMLPEKHSLQSFDEYPVFYTPDTELAAYLEKHQVLVSCFPYPTPGDELVTRVVLNSLHTDADVERLAGLIRNREAGSRAVGS